MVPPDAADRAPVVQVSEVAETTLTFEQVTPATETIAEATNPVPVRFTEVPPSQVPLFGEIAVTVGAAL
jgi:hypothetical protein